MSTYIDEYPLLRLQDIRKDKKQQQKTKKKKKKKKKKKQMDRRTDGPSENNIYHQKQVGVCVCVVSREINKVSI